MTKKKIDKVTPIDEVEEKKLKDTTQPTKTNLVDTMKIVDTISFFPDSGNEWYRNTFKNDLSTKDCTPLQNANLVVLEGKFSESDTMADFKWVEVAFNLLMKYPDHPMILTSFMPKEYFRNKFPRAEFMFSKPNVKFIQMSYTTNDLLDIFKEPKEDQETNESILDTMQFYESTNRYPYLKDFFTTLDLSKFNLKNSIVVDLRPEAWWDDINGIKIAYETLQKHPNTKIILCSLIPIDVYKKVIEWKKSGEYLKILLQGKNVRIIQSSWGNSMTKEEVLKQFDNIYSESKTGENNEWWETFKQLAVIESEIAFQKILEWEISRFLHDEWHKIGDKKEIYNMTYEEKLKYIFNQPTEEKSEKCIVFEDKLINLLQFQHPSYKKVSRERNLWGILDTYKFINQKELPEGTRFEWVFVDRDWCLYDNEKKQFNQKTIDMIKAYEGQGKEITIRTLGNVEIKQKQLDDAGLPYTVKSKIDYKWWTAEVVIDDENQEKFYANTRIKAESYIKI